MEIASFLASKRMDRPLTNALASFRFELHSFLCALLLISLYSTTAIAQPSLSVIDVGVNGNSNREWLVRISPDADLFPLETGQGSIAAELAFEVTTGSLVSVTKDASSWPFDNPGNDPFTGSVSVGVNVDTNAGTLFAALGSNLFTSDAPVDIFTIETAGSGSTTLNWGGHTLLAGQANEYIGSRLAQAGMNFDNFTDSVSVGVSLICDADGDGDCDQPDIDALYAAFGSAGPLDLDSSGAVDESDIALWLAAASDPSNPYKTASGGTASDVYVLGDVNLDGDVNSTDLGQLLNNFGDASTTTWSIGNLNGDPFVDSADLGLLLNNFGAASASAVPEPNAMSILWLGITGLLLVRKRR